MVDPFELGLDLRLPTAMRRDRSQDFLNTMRDKPMIQRFSSKNFNIPSGRREVSTNVIIFQSQYNFLKVAALNEWLDMMIEKLNAQKDLNNLEFVDSFQTVYGTCLKEIIRQVSLHCAERGQLLQKVWGSYLGFLEKAFVENTQEKFELERRFLEERNFMEAMHQKEIQELNAMVAVMKEEKAIYEKALQSYKDKEQYLRKKTFKRDQELSVYKKGHDTLQILYENAKNEAEAFRMALESHGARTDSDAINNYITAYLESEGYHQGLSNYQKYQFNPKASAIRGHDEAHTSSLQFIQVDSTSPMENIMRTFGGMHEEFDDLTHERGVDTRDLIETIEREADTTDLLRLLERGVQATFEVGHQFTSTDDLVQIKPNAIERDTQTDFAASDWKKIRALDNILQNNAGSQIMENESPMISRRGQTLSAIELDKGGKESKLPGANETGIQSTTSLERGQKKRMTENSKAQSRINLGDLSDIVDEGSFIRGGSAIMDKLKSPEVQEKMMKAVAELNAKKIDPLAVAAKFLGENANEDDQLYNLTVLAKFLNANEGEIPDGMMELLDKLISEQKNGVLANSELKSKIEELLLENQELREKLRALQMNLRESTMKVEGLEDEVALLMTKHQSLLQRVKSIQEKNDSEAAEKLEKAHGIIQRLTSQLLTPRETQHIEENKGDKYTKGNNMADGNTSDAAHEAGNQMGQSGPGRGDNALTTGNDGKSIFSQTTKTDPQGNIKPNDQATEKNVLREPGKRSNQKTTNFENRAGGRNESPDSNQKPKISVLKLPESNSKDNPKLADNNALPSDILEDLKDLNSIISNTTKLNITEEEELDDCNFLLLLVQLIRYQGKSLYKEKITDDQLKLSFMNY